VIRNSHIGSVLFERYYLSSEDITEYLVYAGNVDLKGNGESYEIAQVIVHESYDKDDNYFNDIALVRVSQLLFFSVLDYI
jgi:hypothetical protein